MTHTPGPWTTQPIGDETECNILGARRELVATVADCDARLIAAAPDLLKAAQVAERELRELDSSDALFMIRDILGTLGLYVDKPPADWRPFYTPLVVERRPTRV